RAGDRLAGHRAGRGAAAGVRPGAPVGVPGRPYRGGAVPRAGRLLRRARPDPAARRPRHPAGPSTPDRHHRGPPARRPPPAGAGRTVGYDALVLACGSTPFVPPVPGADTPGCFVYRTLDDLDAIRCAAEGRRTGIVVGGGLLGLEAATALRNLGLDTHVVEL